MTEITEINTQHDLDLAYDGSYYFIAGCGGDLQEWVDGYEGMLKEHEIGTPVAWYKTTGALINEFAGASFLEDQGDLFQPDLTCLLFPLEELNQGKLSFFKIMMQDRWFDDVIDNMRRRL